MSPKSFIQFHQEGTKILWVQVRCPQRNRDREKNGPGPRYLDWIIASWGLKMSKSAWIIL